MDKGEADAARAQAAMDLAERERPAGAGQSEVPLDEVPASFVDCGQFDAFFWNWPAIEKFVLPYYLRMAPYQDLAKVVSMLSDPRVVGVAHGDYSPRVKVVGASAGEQSRGYFVVTEGTGKRTGEPTLFFRPL